MIDSVELTRKGWIRHLATLQDMLSNVQDIHTNLFMGFRRVECEMDRAEKIGKGLKKLQELIWESGAVSERLHRECGEADEDFDEYERDMTNESTEQSRKLLHEAAKNLEEIARSLYDATAPELVTPDVVYPWPVGEEEPPEDRRQLKLGLTPLADNAPDGEG